MKLLKRLVYWRSAAARERELREEMESHRDLLRDELERSGLSPQQARQEAARRFGSTLYHGEESRRTWIARAFTDLAADLRYSLRLMRRSPGVTAVAVLSAALGIGVCTAIYTAGSSMLEKPLPVAQPDRLLTISGRSLDGKSPGQMVSAPERESLNEMTQTLTGVTGYFPMLQGVFGGRGEPVRYWGTLATANYFDIVRPGFAAGGGFAQADDQKGRPPVVVLSYSLWQSRFNGDRSLVGSSVEMNGRMVTVAGITAQGFRGTDTATVSDFWIPFSMAEELTLLPEDVLREWDSNWLFLLGRLRDQATLAGATRELDVIAARLRKDNLKMSKRTYGLETAGRIYPVVRGAVETIYYLLLAVSLLVLLIACANIANLLLARAAARQKEIATRMAIGAGRARLIRQLMTESLLLAGLGGAGGLLLCWLTVPLLAHVDLPVPAPLDLELGLNSRVLVFAAMATVLTGLVFGLVPAWKASRQSYVGALKGESLGGRRWSLRDVLVVAQVTVAVVLLVGAGLLLRSLQSAARLETGIGARNLLLVAVDPGLRHYPPAQAHRFLDEVSRRIAAQPGVESVATTSRLPLGLLGVSVTVTDPRRKDSSTNVQTDLYSISPGLFSTLRVPVLQGEEFAPRHENGDGVAILNRAAAQKLFGEENPLGLRLGSLGKPYRVIGVTENFSSATLGTPANPSVFVLRTPRDNSPAMFGTYFLVRTAGEPLGYLPAVKQAIRALDANMAILDTKTWSRHHDQALLVPRLAAFIVAFCGSMGFLIAAIGLYGVIRYSVERRTRELGVRLALGARPGSVLGLVLKQGAWLTGIGLALGLALSFGMGRAIQGMLYGIPGSDALTYALVVPLVLLIALAASWLPARRAAQLNPVDTLRYD